MSKHKAKPQKESLVVQGILQWAGYKPGLLLWKSRGGTVQLRTGNWVNFGPKGLPDLVGMYRGRFIGCECKTAKGKQSDVQKEFQEKVEKHGGIYVLARAVADLEAALEAE